MRDGAWIRWSCASRAARGPAEIARQALLDPEHPVGPMAELFFYPGRAGGAGGDGDPPGAAAGRVVLSDRFALSTEAYQMAGRGIPPEVVLPANRAAAGGLEPDLTLILDLPPEVGRARQVAAGKRLDRLERESPNSTGGSWRTIWRSRAMGCDIWMHVFRRTGSCRRRGRRSVAARLPEAFRGNRLT